MYALVGYLVIERAELRRMQLVRRGSVSMSNGDDAACFVYVLLTSACTVAGAVWPVVAVFFTFNLLLVKNSGDDLRPLNTVHWGRQSDAHRTERHGDHSSQRQRP